MKLTAFLVSWILRLDWVHFKVQDAQTGPARLMIFAPCLILSNVSKNLIVYSVRCLCYSGRSNKISNVVSDKISDAFLNAPILVGKNIPKGTTLLVAPVLVHISAEVSLGRIKATCKQFNSVILALRDSLLFQSGSFQQGCDCSSESIRLHSILSWASKLHRSKVCNPSWEDASLVVLQTLHNQAKFAVFPQFSPTRNYFEAVQGYPC
jgi:hypothetical protein